MIESNPELTRFKTILVTITLEHPSMPLSEALLLAGELEAKILEQRPEVIAETIVNQPVPHVDSTGFYEALVKWCKYDPETIRWVNEGKKINAIKHVRTKSGAGLKQAKEAVEEAFPRGTPPF